MATRREFLSATVALTAALALPGASAAGTELVLPGATLPVPRPWRARSGEVQPRVKQTAVTLIDAVGVWDASTNSGAGSQDAARKRAAQAGYDPALADALHQLFGPGVASTLRVRDAQYGGIKSTTASVLVVVDSWRDQGNGVVTPGGFTVDVRLTRVASQWRVVEVHPAQPHTRSTNPSALARQVLASRSINLPFSARADVAGGQIHASVLRTLLDLGHTYLVDVSVIQSGHPRFVFGTSRLSDHPRGRAVDIWALDGKPLVVPANHRLAVRAMRSAVDTGAYNVGGPVQLRGSQYFSDATHQDHIHLGFRA